MRIEENSAASSGGSVRSDLPDRAAAKALIHFGFVVMGVVTVILGPILPILIARWSLSDERAGLFFVWQFCGNLLGVASLGVLLSWRGYRGTLSAGYVLVALGIAGLASGSEGFGLLATAVFGYGMGLVLSASNLWVAEIAPTRRAAAVSVLNVVWGIGAIACAPLVMFAHRGGMLGPLLYCVAGLSIAVGFALAAMEIEPVSQTGADAAKPLPSIGKRTAVALGALFFLYVGTESSVSGWGAAFAKRTGAASGNLWELAPMFFWVGLIAGRALVTVILPRITERALVMAGLTVAGLSNGALVCVSGFRAAIACLVATGIGLACVYPLLVAWMVGYYGAKARRGGNILFGLASLGGASMPWLVGFISTRANSLRAGLLSPLIGCFAMLGLQFLLRKPALI
jgi:FHS family glucose/mannose:H+ symporter-like MFS transporter